MNELALFTGAGGGILGGHLLGWTTVGAVEIEKYPRESLLQRQRDGILPKFPIWDDVCTFDGRPWKGAVDLISGGFPCQDISAAGKGAGIDGDRSGLWREYKRIIDEVRPRFAFVENSPMLTSRGLGTVLGDLAELGYDARWCVLGADDAGAPHVRKRIWILAYTGDGEGRNGERRSSGGNGKRKLDSSIWPSSTASPSGSSQESEVMADTGRQGLQGSEQSGTRREERNRTDAHGSASECGDSRISWWDYDPADIPDTDRDGFSSKNKNAPEPRSYRKNDRISERNDNRPTKPVMGRVAHGVAHRVDRLKAIGNGQVPATMALAFLTLSEGVI